MAGSGSRPPPRATISPARLAHHPSRAPAPSREFSVQTHRADSLSCPAASYCPSQHLLCMQLGEGSAALPQGHQHVRPPADPAQPQDVRVISRQDDPQDKGAVDASGARAALCSCQEQLLKDFTSWAWQCLTSSHCLYLGWLTRGLGSDASKKKGTWPQPAGIHRSSDARVCVP